MEREQGYYVVGITDSTAETVGKTFLPLGPYRSDETSAMDAGQLWIAEVYDESTGTLRLWAADLDCATSTARRYLRREYETLREVDTMRKTGVEA